MTSISLHAQFPDHERRLDVSGKQGQLFKHQFVPDFQSHHRAITIKPFVILLAV